jgi:hypothetical protein
MYERGKKSGLGCVIAGVFCLFIPVLYVLGIGPAALLANYVDESQDFVGMLYLPLAFVAEYCQPVEDAMNWYVDLWL